MAGIGLLKSMFISESTSMPDDQPFMSMPSIPELKPSNMLCDGMFAMLPLGNPTC